ncbi:hypothetical protein G5714_021842 [Onychostoma macrolepis]|uniref:Ig-like domain-containing protein n=1 Tax=Onychostoma macrolepis TaxID=369639 RepID=A0A7J6BSI2_9TELE|nr:hypothetical protein G5714_021842 [Onychostoma macrolepis]
MIIRFYFICVFAVLIHKVSLQVTVEAVFGGSVVLPCSSAKHDHKPQDIEVFWRHNGSKIVFDIIKGKDSVKGQDPRYKNRVQTFPEEYVRGNFSLKLNNLQHTDSGKYTCFISHSSEHETVELIIDETTTEYGTKSPKTENGTKSADQENQNPETESAQLSECHNQTVVDNTNWYQWQAIGITSTLLNGLLLIVLIGVVKVFVVGKRSAERSQKLNSDLQRMQVIEQHQDSNQLQYAEVDFSKIRRNIRSSQINSTYAALNLPKS